MRRHDGTEAADPGYDVHATKGDHVGHGGRHETHEPDQGHENHANEAGVPLESGYMTRKADYQRRLRRIEGQVRGINRMVDEEAYCIDILTQVSAVTKALEVVALGLLDEHLTHCVAGAAKTDGRAADRKFKEASEAIARLVRT